MDIWNKAKDMVNSYVGTDVEQKIIEATSTESWSASNTLKLEICRYTSNYETYQEATELVWKRLGTDHEGNGAIIIFKTLELIHFMMLNASPRFVNDVSGRRYTVAKFQHFSYNNGEKDYSSGIRERAQKILALLDDSEELANQRTEASNNSSQYASMGSSGSRYGGMGGGGGNSYSGNSYGGQGNNYQQRSQPSYGNGGGGSYGSQEGSRQAPYGQTRSTGPDYSSGTGGSRPQQSFQQQQQQPQHQQSFQQQQPSQQQQQQQPKDSFAEKDQFTQAAVPTQRRTLGQASNNTNLQLKKPSQQAQQQQQQQQAPQQIDPFAEAERDQIVVNQTSADPFGDDPFGAAKNDFDAFTEDEGPAQTTQQAAVPTTAQAAPAAPTDDVFALLGSSSAPIQQPQNSTDSFMALYNQQPQPQTNPFGNLGGQQQQPQFQQQQQFQQQPQNLNPYDFSHPQQQQPQQPAYNFAQPTQQQQQQQQQFSQSAYSFNNPQQPAYPQQQQASTDPFAALFNASSAPQQQQQQQRTAAPQAQAVKKNDDPFDFGF